MVCRRWQPLKEGRALIAERQKLIKIADRSELGWAVVNEYTADELAANSDDEKRIEKAEKAAKRKVARKRKAAPGDKAKTPKRSMPPVQMQPHPPSTQFQLPGMRRAPTLPAKQPGPCFACGEMGHLRSYCPKTPSSSNKVWYPFYKVHSSTECGVEKVDSVCGRQFVYSTGMAVLPVENQSETLSPEGHGVRKPHVKGLALSPADGSSHEQGSHVMYRGYMGGGCCAW